jgi:AcrR family transcriptional regulator
MSGKRTFDDEKALESAMGVFWKKGYAGASLAELTQSMGINKPSMYRTFGNKEALFLKATQRYIEQNAKPHFVHLHQAGESLHERIKSYMLSVVSEQCTPSDPKGCYIFLCQSEIAGGDIPELPSNLLIEAGNKIQDELINIFTTDPEAIALGLNTRAASIALCIVTTLRGTASMARAGIALSELEAVIEHSLRGIGLTS